jgi:predicted CXXCH cytochrome family protein
MSERDSADVAPAVPRLWAWGALLCAVTAGLCAAVLVLWGRPAQAESGDRFDNQWCLSCHRNPGMKLTLTDGTVLNLTVDDSMLEASVHGPYEIPCVICHTEIQRVPHDPVAAESRREFSVQEAAVCGSCHESQATQTADNAHAAARAEGNLEAAVCTDCHGSHGASRPKASSIEVPAVCAHCHSEIYDLYLDSVHGAALTQGNTDVPTCTDCHGVHTIEGPAVDEQFRLFSPLICARCHADKALMEKYGISTQVFQTYVTDFHGKTVTLFERLAPNQETNKPVCIDCHGVHAILAPTNPESTVFRANLLHTCQRCHPDATSNFPAAWLGHYAPAPGKATLVFAVVVFYKVLIPVVIGGMALYVLADAFRKRRARRREGAHA